MASGGHCVRSRQLKLLLKWSSTIRKFDPEGVPDLCLALLTSKRAGSNKSEQDGKNLENS